MHKSALHCLKAALCLLVFALIIAGGCKSSDPVIVNESNNGGEIKLSVNQLLVVKLKGNPTTGYTWEIKENCSLLRQVEEAEFEPESNLIGAPGTQTLVFRAVNSGRESLELVYHRSWEKDIPPEKIFSVAITIE